MSLEQTKYKETIKDGLNSSKYQKLNENLKSSQSFDEYLNSEDEVEGEFNSHLDEDSNALDNGFKYNDMDIKLKTRNINEEKNEKLINSEKNKLNKISSNIETNSVCFLECDLKSDKKFILIEKNLSIREEKVFSHIDNINEVNSNSSINKRIKLKNSKKVNKNDTNRKTIKRSNNKKTIKNKKSKINCEYSLNPSNVSNQIFHSSSENYSPTSSISTSNTSFTNYDYHHNHNQINYNQQQLQQMQHNNYAALSSCTMYSPVSNPNNAYVPEFFELIQPNKFQDYQLATKTSTSNHLMTSSYHYQPDLTNKILHNSKLNQDYNNYQHNLNYNNTSQLAVSSLSIDSIKVPSSIDNIIANKKDNEISNIYSQKSKVKDLEIKLPIQPFNNLVNETNYKNVSLNNIDKLRNYNEYNSKLSNLSTLRTSPSNTTINTSVVSSIKKINNTGNNAITNLPSSGHGNCEHKQEKNNHQNNEEINLVDKQKIDKQVTKNLKSNIEYNPLNSKSDTGNNNKNTSKSKFNNIITNDSYENSLMDNSNCILQSNISNYHHYHLQLNNNLTNLYKTSLINTNNSTGTTNALDEKILFQMNLSSTNSDLNDYAPNKPDVNQQKDENEIYNQNSQSISNRGHLSGFNEVKTLTYYNNNSMEIANAAKSNSVNRLSNPNEDLNIPVCYDYNASNRQSLPEPKDY